MMTSEQIRKSFLDFFAARDHKVTAGTSLIPEDPTTLFTSAGVQQFVPAFRGDVPAPAPRLATCQKCLRADDIDEVGDAWHETFFEMLGNFSIGDYFKKEAIEWAWEYSVKELDLPTERIWISVHPEDDEAYSTWRKIGVPEDKIVKLEDNWWPLSDTWVGSCGPDSELYLDIGEEFGCGRADCRPGCSCDRFNEYWNLVFPQFFQEAPGKRRPLENPGVDTGLGLERLAALLQGKNNIFETDIFQPIVEAIHKRAKELNPDYKIAHSTSNLTVIRIIADHSRAVAFSLAEGVLPSNEGRGYVVRKLLRRASYFGWKLCGALSAGDARQDGLQQFLTPVVKTVCATMESAYHELGTNLKFIQDNVAAEEERFEAAVLSGFPLLEKTVRECQGRLPGETLFKFYDTYGIPLDLTREIAAESGLEVDEEGFEAELHKQRARSRAAVGEKFAAQRSGVYQEFIGATKFVGYEKTQAEAKVLSIIQDGEKKQNLASGEAEIILDHTPFYAEAGGQVGDTGTLESADTSCEVLDTTLPIAGVIAHHVRVKKGSLKVGGAVQASANSQRRQAIARAHTATHLLHFALRETLGEHSLQSGSLVDADYLRFDFSHFERPSTEQLGRIASEVNRLILENRSVEAVLTDQQTARSMGAMALFGEKYGEEVRVLLIGDFSKELCGGTHLRSTGEVGSFVITSEGSIGAGLRRIEALTGLRAMEKMREDSRRLAAVAKLLRTPEEDIVRKIEDLLNELKQTQRKMASAQHKQARGLADDLLASMEKVGEIPVIASRVPPLNQDALRSLADSLIDRLGSGVVVLASEGEKRSSMVAKVSPDLVKKGFHAGKIIGEVAKAAGGGGGGRPDFAQAGIKDVSRLDEALAQVRILLTEQQ
ncbi:MAG: alanine--tRNA ligase [Armatimonadetes bacterium]|nr:alanine--tRNA ligase [Armatimonadota bacterium]NIM23934.1 alanine--tRNA ligase [Armatimonadota bacterium]NIM67781.1 alanine--tRNA ligase [Armatimonadota bacterium]NIM76321.1 alanine--tRNA ligase [Armatimonadota bacterium]NIN06015.1 alanine--tRNA ligase [Armatimonadota bacterium]